MRETLRDGGRRGLVLHGPRERSEPTMHNRAAGEIPLGRLLFFLFLFPDIIEAPSSGPLSRREKFSSSRNSLMKTNCIFSFFQCNVNLFLIFSSPPLGIFFYLMLYDAGIVKSGKMFFREGEKNLSIFNVLFRIYFNLLIGRFSSVTG